MELPSKILKQTAIKTNPEIEEPVLMVLDKSTHVQHLAQPLQTHNKQFKKAVYFLTDSNGNFNVTDKNNKFYFTVSINDDDFNHTTVQPGAHEIQSLNNEIKRNIFEERYFTETTYPFTIKPNFSTLESNIEISSPNTDSQIASTPDDSIRDLLGFKPKLLHEEYILSD